MDFCEIAIFEEEGRWLETARRNLVYLLGIRRIVPRGTIVFSEIDDF
jgi:hypothetical protein